MLYNFVERSNYMETAGKITIAAAVCGVLVFAFVFLFNAGKVEIQRVEAQNASTTLTVLNTPPQWVTLAYEELGSSTSSPTNSGSQISWVALADDSSSAPYFLLVCSTSATPTANAAATTSALGTAPPVCNGGVQWGVSTATASLNQARVATTTTEVAPFSGEILNWYAWVCDDAPINPRCNNSYSQGLNATNSSPFHVNFRPTLTSATSTSPVNPGAILTFTSVSGDGNVVRGPDNIFLYVCSGNDFVAATRTCASGVLASTSGSVTSNAGASFTLPPVVQDDNYNAWVFIVDQYNHPGSGGYHAQNPGFKVNNVAPTVAGGTISLNGGSNISISVPNGQTTGFTLGFVTSDANSCVNVASTSEMKSYTVALTRGSLTGSLCPNALASSYNPNYCYTSGSATSTWNLSCTASSTSCSGALDPTISWSCTFPLWYVAQPTDSSSPYNGDNWVAVVAGVDDNNATGTPTTSTASSTLISFPAIDLITAEIPYGALEPGDKTPLLSATTTILSVGNTGLNQNVDGDAMCPGFTASTTCGTNSASSTIPDYKQQFATTSVSYGSGLTLSSTTPKLLLLKVQKTSSTTNPNRGVTYWGIEVPVAITVAGAYTGLNTFYAVTSAAGDW